MWWRVVDDRGDSQHAVVQDREERLIRDEDDVVNGTRGKQASSRDDAETQRPHRREILVGVVDRDQDCGAIQVTSLAGGFLAFCQLSSNCLSLASTASTLCSFYHY
jgi:hypothetical protein